MTVSNNHRLTDNPYWDQFRDTSVGRRLLAREQAFVRQALDELNKPARLLELCACGGRVMLPLRDKTASLIASDIDHQAMTLFRHRSNDLPAITADAQHLPLAEASLDCVVAIQCLRYFDHDRFLRGCHRVLDRGGWLIIQAVNRRGYKRRLKELVRPAKRAEESGTFATQEVLRMVREAGFEIQRVEGYNWPPFKADSGRFSDSRLVHLLDRLESSLGLGRFHNISPWILLAAQKVSG